jgi:hypothetical protein
LRFLKCASSFQTVVNLSSDQKAMLKQWVDEGFNLSEIQVCLNALIAPASLMYRDVRFLLDDLNLKIRLPEVPEALPAAKKSLEETMAEADAPNPGAVQVTLNPIQRPGMVATGNVVFSDGEKAEWYFDEMGRLGLVPATAGYRPTQEDGVEFQKALRNLLG